MFEWSKMEVKLCFLYITQEISFVYKY